MTSSPLNSVTSTNDASAIPEEFEGNYNHIIIVIIQTKTSDTTDHQPEESTDLDLKIEQGHETNGEDEVEKPDDQKPPSKADNSEEICQNTPGSSESLSLSLNYYM